MGSGIAQVAAQAGAKVIITDQRDDALQTSKNKLSKIMDRLVEKGRISSEDSSGIQSRISYSTNNSDLSDSDLIIEAIIENLDVKKSVFQELESIVSEDCILATNTSSLSVTAVAAACKNASRVLGIHFFNPAPLMPLVEIIPAMQSSEDVVKSCNELISAWGKVTVKAKDTPGFIVNRVARPFYSESIRIYEEGWASFYEIDNALKELGGFRMGPFELMDLIGNDVNYAVTESVWEAFYFDPKYKPSFTQKRLVEAGWYGRKSGRGYYDHNSETELHSNLLKPVKEEIFNRVLTMLINDAADAVFWGVASPKDIDLAMTKGVNYPKGLLKWADEIGISEVVQRMNQLREKYKEDRYRPCPLLVQMANEGSAFFD